MGESKFLELIQHRWEGLQILRQRLGDKAIDFQLHGGFELVLENQNYDFLNQLEKVNNLLEPMLGKEVFSVQNEKIKDFGFNTNSVKQLVQNKVEGQIDSGKMMRALLDLCKQKGVTILNGAQVESLTESQQGMEVNCIGIQLKARAVFLCTNAFTKTFLPDEDLQPGRGQVIVTKPIDNLKIKGIFSFDEGYYYFRNIENRIIFGGGRNLDFEGEQTIEFGSNQFILNQLKQHLKDTILPETPFEIDYNWSGIMAFGGNKQALVKKVSNHLYVGARLNGMGVAIGSKVAQQLLTLLRQHS
jgi:glycine/D-amino acid oxidase-like deaminating enzyme